MKTYDMTQHKEWAIKIANMKGYDPETAVIDYAAKTEITTEFETKPHTFKDGETGEVAKKLTITIDFKDTAIQPDSDFESHFAEVCMETLKGHIAGLWENQQDEEQ